MSKTLVHQFPRIEGRIGLFLEETEAKSFVRLQSAPSLRLEERLVGKYPLEVIQHTQGLSSKTGLFHGLAAVLAIEDYFQIAPTATAQHVRQVMMQIATIHTHIHHFYWEVLPNYLNQNHLQKLKKDGLLLHPQAQTRKKDEGDLSLKAGEKILGNIPQAIKCLGYLHKCLTLLGGKYPLVMNLIPGGVTNFRLQKDQVMGLIVLLQKAKPFIEDHWPNDVKLLIKDLPESTKVLETDLNLISFGSLPVEKISENSSTTFSSGVLIDGRLEPLNELKITESFDHTYYTPPDEVRGRLLAGIDPNKKGAYTWTKGAMYEGESMLTGPLARMMLTHFGGGNLEVSDSIGQMIDDLGLTTDAYNCMASRLLAEVFEGRISLKAAMGTLLAIDTNSALNLNQKFDFSRRGTGTGVLEAPSGSLLHQVYIKDDQIAKYRIISPFNWNFFTNDRFENTGVVDKELNYSFQKKELSSLQSARILTSYNAQVVDGTR